MIRKIALVLLALLCAGALAFAAGGAEKPAAGKITLAYTGYPGGLTAFWAQMAQYVKEEATALGVELVDMSPTTADAAVQKESVDNAINRGVSGIIIGAIDNRLSANPCSGRRPRGSPWSPWTRPSMILTSARWPRPTTCPQPACWDSTSWTRPNRVR